MIEKEEYERLWRIRHELDKASSTTIWINHEQVLNIVVSDLLNKYQGNINNDWGPIFKKILSFYITDDELSILMKPES